jgi:hypothetical protein
LDPLPAWKVEPWLDELELLDDARALEVELEGGELVPCEDELEEDELEEDGEAGVDAAGVEARGDDAYGLEPLDPLDPLYPDEDEVPGALEPPAPLLGALGRAGLGSTVLA